MRLLERAIAGGLVYAFETPKLAALRVHDNTAEADPAKGRPPVPRLVLHMERRRILGPRELAATPAWAKAIVAQAVRISA